VKSALGPVAAALVELLQDSQLQALTPGGWHDDAPQAVQATYGWYELRARQERGMGTGTLPEIELRAHVFSRYEGLQEARAAIARLEEVLGDAALPAMSGFEQCGRIFWDETVSPLDEEINGVKVKELVAFFRIYLEAA
jgi:hypothetical protein